MDYYYIMIREEKRGSGVKESLRMKVEKMGNWMRAMLVYSPIISLYLSSILFLQYYILYYIWLE